MKLLLLNSSLITAPGSYKMHPISQPEAAIRIAFAAMAGEFDSAIDAWATAAWPADIEGLEYDGLISAVGHQATVDVLNQILEFEHAHTVLTLNRISVSQEEGQHAVVFKLKTRLPEGVVLDSEAMRQVEYEFFLLTRLTEPTPNALSQVAYCDSQQTCVVL